VIAHCYTTSFAKFSNMSLKPIGNVLGSVSHQYRRKHHRQIQQVQEYWAELVGAAVAAQTHPLSVYRDVLKVATSSSAWAQNLTFERQRILEKLNTYLSEPLTDIRFSTANWQNNPPNQQILDSKEQAEIWQNHPSLLSSLPKALPTAPQNKAIPIPDGVDSETAFRAWSKRIKARSRDLPLCPHCSCPTPPGELERWSLCSLCAAKQW
jgi:predicted nucleic acid-binding Zn ribbon protein